MFSNIFNLFRREPLEPKIYTMEEIDRDIIYRFAVGDNNLRIKAIKIHRRYIPLLGVRGTLEQSFMSEVDTPMPDLGLRDVYRNQIKVIRRDND